MTNRFASALGSAVVCCLAGCHHEPPYQMPLTPVAISSVTEYTGGGGARYSGSIAPNMQVSVSFKVAGYVEYIAPAGGRTVQEGDFVRKGEILTRVRQTDYQAKLNEATSHLSSTAASVEQAGFAIREAQVGVEKAGLDFKRAQNLFRTESITKPDFDAATAQWDASQARFGQAIAQKNLAESQVETARAQLEGVRIAMTDTELRAPQDALVLKRLIEVGTLVNVGSVGFVLADTRIMKAVFGAPDTLLPNLHLGLPLQVTTEAVPGVNFAGRITGISPAADTRTRVFDIEIAIPNPRGLLKPGMVAAIQVPSEKPVQPIPVVPLTAVIRSKSDPNAYGVFVVEKQGDSMVPRARTVILGDSFGNLIAVKQGVRPGEKVIVTGATLVRDGEPVQIIPE